MARGVLACLGRAERDVHHRGIMNQLAHISEKNHRGHGPRDWRKSDERLREEVCEALAADAWLDARDLNVGVDEGEVVLSGVAPCFEARERAEDIAGGVVGVRAVHNFVGIKACLSF